MALPEQPLRTGTSDIGGTQVPIRAMSRTEVVRFRSFSGREDDAEPFVVSCGAGVTEDEAAAWLSSVDAEVGGRLIFDILVLSGLVDPRAGSTGDGPTERPQPEP